MNSCSFFNENELATLGLKEYGENVLISSKTSIYSPEKISIGNNVRIDDFCILSGLITLHSNIHIGAFCALYGSKGIVMEDYTGLSPRTTIFSATDDFSGDYFISPMVPEQYTNVTGGLVLIKRYSQIGAGCIVFPNIIINEGVAVGAMSLINKNLEEWGIFTGIPVKYIKARNKNMLNFIPHIQNQKNN
jgi:dTDP-4-amino-4,6-dideoxy-D-glucose acyltransferase